MKQQRAIYTKIKNYVLELGMVIDKEITEHEILIVSSQQYGFKNLVIDLEEELILFKLRLGYMKDTFDKVEGKEVTRAEVEKEFARLNNPFYEGGMTTGQFTWDEADDNILVFAEQEFLRTLDGKSLENILTGFSDVLIDKIDFITYATVSNVEGA